jgi:hypothetical protein
MYSKFCFTGCRISFSHAVAVAVFNSQHKSNARGGKNLVCQNPSKKSDTLPETSLFRKIEKADSGGLVVGKGDFFDVRTMLIHHHYFSSN